MRTLAIFRKDVRRLWPLVLLFCALLALVAFCDPAYTDRLRQPEIGALLFATGAACATLVIAAIQQEALPGDRQYWLTRPISRASLMAAKTLFVCCTVNAAVLVSHIAVLTILGIPAIEYAGALVYFQLALTVLLVLPAAALAAITRTLAQACLVVLLIAALFLAGANLSHGDQVTIALFAAGTVPREWIVGACWLMFMLPVIGIQYWRRPTNGPLVAVLAAIPVLWFAGQSFFYVKAAPPLPVYTMTLDSNPSARRSHAPAGAIEIPIRLHGIPEGTAITVLAMRGGFGPPDLTQKWTNWSAQAVIHDLAGGQGWLTVYNGQEQFFSELNTPMNWVGKLYISLSKTGRVLPLPGRSGLGVPGIGMCAQRESAGEISVYCVSPEPHASLALEFANGARRWIVTKAPRPEIEALGLQPLRKFTAGSAYSATDLEGARLIQGDIVATIEVEYYFTHIRLADYR